MHWACCFLIGENEPLRLIEHLIGGPSIKWITSDAHEHIRRLDQRIIVLRRSIYGLLLSAELVLGTSLSRTIIPVHVRGALMSDTLSSSHADLGSSHANHEVGKSWCEREWIPSGNS
jgi:hypothetical protein